MLASDVSSKSPSIRDESYWQEIIKRFKVSGLTQKQFCSENNLPIGAFKNWYYRFYRSRSTEETAGFTPIVLGDNASSSSRLKESNLILELPNAIKIIISPDFEEGTLRRVLKIVGRDHC